MESNTSGDVLSQFSTKGELPYPNALHTVQEGVTGKFTKDASAYNESEIKDIILRYIREHNITCSLTSNPTELTNYIYHDMAGLSFITRDSLFDRPGFEELNINAWNDIDIKEYGVFRKTNYSFLSSQQAIDMHLRMFRMSKTPFSEVNSRATADIGNGIRITAERTPIVDEDVAVCSSIRKVNTDSLPPEKLIEDEELTPKMLRLLQLNVEHGVSMSISGETGAGKTAFAGALLTEASKKLRTITIEQGSREWDFRCYDENGKVTNSVVHLKTRLNEDNPKQNIDQDDLVQDAMRLDPDILAPGEMRGKEAFEVMAAANTGHVVVTTVHSNGTEDTPERIITLAKKAYDMSDISLFKICSRAFPILVHIELLPDKKRRVTEIREVTGCVNGEIESQLLYEFVVYDNIYEGDVCVKTDGEFRRLSPISTRLAQLLLKKGARRSDIEPYTSPVKGGDKHEQSD